jgi:hypothetical protein
VGLFERVLDQSLTGILGKKPEVQRVTEWPGQFESEKQCKIPSWIWYNAEGKVCFGYQCFVRVTDYLPASEVWRRGVPSGC